MCSPNVGVRRRLDATSVQQAAEERCSRRGHLVQKDTVIRAGLCLNNRGVHLLSQGCFNEAREVFEDAIYVLKSSRRPIANDSLGRILKRKLNRAQAYVLQAPKLLPDREPLSIWINVISGDDCLSRLGRLDIFAQISLLAFRLETHDELNYTSAVLLHNLAISRIGLGEYTAAVRLLTTANGLLTKCTDITSGTINTAMVIIGALMHCYGESGFPDGLKECQEKIQLLREALKEFDDFRMSQSVHSFAAAA